MEVFNVSFMVASMALVTLIIYPGKAFHFHCDVQDEMLIGPFNFVPTDLWLNQTVPYELDITLTPADVIQVMIAIYDIQNKTCIRFVTRAANESAYVSIQHDDDVCGIVSDFGRTGGFQTARFGGVCTFANIMVHEFGHTLGLAHEMSRKDRDDYVHFYRCGRDTFQEKDDFDTKGYLYDYTSIMHYQCNWCLGGWPKMKGVSKCGWDITKGLSVIDADKINDLYDCQGCFSHRWRRTENLTTAEKGELISFGKTVDNKDVYLCRTYIGRGEIAPGEYDLDNNICTVTFYGEEFQIKEKVQVFTVPDLNERNRYGLSESKENLVHVGRTRHSLTIFAAVAEYEDGEGMSGKVIGKVYVDNFCTGYFSINHVVVSKSRFLLIGCI